MKAVLLNNGNDLESIPIGYSMNMTEKYDNMNMVLENIGYLDIGYNVLFVFGTVELTTVIIRKMYGLFVKIWILVNII